MKFSFKNDYAEGCHPRILEALIQNNLVQQPGYGLDEHSAAAAKLIKHHCKSPDAAVHFVSGGTQANLLVISAALRPHESVISASTGHIFTNETAAIEATGHKVNHIDTADGKITPQQIEQVLQAHTNVPHQVKPKMVYISNATEVGTIYSRKELEDISTFCRSRQLYLYLDGARLGPALAAHTSDLNLEEVARLTDVFYLGGTKNGALLGEAIVINHPELQMDFGFHVKQKGAMLAKGRLLGIQFEELMRDGLYFDLSKHANQQAMRIKEAFLKQGIGMLADTETNQIFPVLAHHEIEQLQQKFDFYVWQKVDAQKSAIRIITSWATTDEAVAEFLYAIESLNHH